MSEAHGPMRVVFLGAGAFGLPTLRALAGDGAYHLTGVVTQPDKPAGRGMRLTPTPIGQWCAEHLPGVELIKPANVNEPDVLARVRAWPADAWVVIAFGQKLSAPLLEGRFAVNLHASVLPRWRGAAPINAAILAGDESTGNSVITLADRMDAGLVLGTSHRAIEPLVTAGELHDLLSEDGPALVKGVLQKHRAGTLACARQDESLVTKARKLGRADGTIDWARPARAIRCQVHGLTPWPGVTVGLHGQGLKLLRVLDEDAAGAPVVQPPGAIVDAAQGLVACGDGRVLRLLSVQPAGKKPMDWRALVAGRAVKAGEVLGATPVAGAPGGE